MNIIKRLKSEMSFADKGYLFGVNIITAELGRKALISVTKNEFWDESKYSKYSKNYITYDIKNVFEYFGYEQQSLSEWQFVTDADNGNDEYDIIDELIKSPLLKYNECFDEFTKTYVFGFCTDKILSVTPKIHWLNNNTEYDYPSYKYLDDFLTKKIGLKTDAEINYPYNKYKENRYWIYNSTKSEILKNLNNFKYLEYDSTFEDYLTR